MKSASLLLLLAVLGSAWAQPVDIEHKIPPGYEPGEARDEQGIWMELEELEAQVNKSALLVRDPELNNYIRDITCRVAAEYCNDFRVWMSLPSFRVSYPSRTASDDTNI